MRHSLLAEREGWEGEMTKTSRDVTEDVIEFEIDIDHAIETSKDVAARFLGAQQHSLL